MRLPTRIRAALGSLLLLALFLAAWQLATLPAHDARSGDPEYAALLGARKSGLPAPAQIAEAAWAQLKSPFHDGGMNDKGIAIQLAWSLGRVLLGFALAALVAVPLGFFVGTSPVVHGALNPYVQLLKPISPLAWMPLFLYTIKDSSAAAMLVIFMSSLWPTLANTAFGVASIRRDYLNVAALLQLSWPRRLVRVVLPAAAPAIVAGLRISIGSAWVAIVAAEMLIGGTGIGYFVWNEWNNLALTSVIFAILAIGVIGVLLDAGLGRLSRRLAYTE